MGAAAAVIIIKERRLVEAFSAAAATSPERARTVESLGIESDASSLKRLQKNAVIREGAPGRYYLDTASWEALRRMRRRMMIVLIMIVIAALAAVVIGFRVRVS